MLTDCCVASAALTLLVHSALLTQVGSMLVALWSVKHVESIREKSLLFSLASQCVRRKMIVRASSIKQSTHRTL